MVALDRVCPTGAYVAILDLSPGQHNLAVSIFHFPSPLISFRLLFQNKQRNTAVRYQR